MYHSYVSIFMTFRVNLLKQDPIAGESLRWHCPTSFQCLQDCSRLNPCLPFCVHPVPPASHSLCSSHNASPATCHAHLPPQVLFLLFPTFIVWLRMHLPHASPSLRSRLKGLLEAVLTISSLTHHPVHVCHSAHHFLK